MNNIVINTLFNNILEKYNLLLNRIQNFILFFASVKKINHLLELINNNKDKSKDILTLSNSKKFSLRDSKYKDVEIEELQLGIYTKIIEYREKIESLKSKALLKEFFSFVKQKNYSENIFLNENMYLESESKMKLSLYSHNVLYNVIFLTNNFINCLVNDKLILENLCMSYRMEDVLKLKEAYKMYKNIYLNDVKEEDVYTLLNFYYIAVENCGNFKEYLEYILNYQNFFDSRISNIKEKLERSKTEKDIIIDQFGNNINGQYYNKLSFDYNEKYYHDDNTKNNRIYKLENLAMNWTETDYKKFHEGLEKFKTHQLANRKIATYMGTHIQTSHVKYYRSKILKQEKDKRKMDKNSKIKQMKKQKRNIQWKINLKQGSLPSVDQVNQSNNLITSENNCNI